MKCQQCGAFLECIIGRMYYPCPKGCADVPDKPILTDKTIYYASSGDWDSYVFDSIAYVGAMRGIPSLRRIPVTLSGDFDIEDVGEQVYRITPMPEATMTRVKDT